MPSVTLMASRTSDICGHNLFDSMDPALLAGVDAAADEDTSLAGVQYNNTTLAGVPLSTTTVATNNHDALDAISDHNSIYSIRGVQVDDTSLAGVPILTTTIVTNNMDDLDTKSDHNSVDPNQADKNSSKSSLHSIRIHIPVHYD